MGKGSALSRCKGACCHGSSERRKRSFGIFGKLYLELRDDEDFPATTAVKGAGAVEPGAALAPFLAHGTCVVANTPVAGARWKR